MTVAVTGASGKLGWRVAQRLSASGVEQLLVGRDLSRLSPLPGATRRGPAAYGDRSSMEVALEGAEVLFLVSAHLSGHRLEEHTAAVEAAAAVGIRRVVYTSLVGASLDATYLNARDHAETERFLRGCGVSFTILRCGIYASMLPGLTNTQGVIRGPAGSGKVSPVSHDDLADVAAIVLSSEDGEHDGRTYEVTGPEALTLDQIAERLTSVLGKKFTFEDQTVKEAYASRYDLDATPSQVEGWVTWYQAIKAGEVARVTNTILSLTGHSAKTLEGALRAGGSGRI